MRKIWLSIGTALVVMLLAVAAALLLVDVNQFRGRIQAELQARLGRPVTLGAMGLKLVPLAIRAESLAIGETPAFRTGRPFAAAKELRVSVGLLPLLRKQIRFDSLVLLQPAIELVRGPSGRWNFSDLGGQSGQAGGQAGGGFAISELRVEDGRLAVSDLGDPKSRSVYDHIDITLSDFAPGREFGLTAAIRLPDSRDRSVTLELKGGPAGAAAAPFSGRLTLADASLSGLLSFLGSSGARPVGGAISGAADFQSRDSVVNVKGDIGSGDLRLRGAELGYPVRTAFTLAYDARSGVLSAPRLDVTAGKLPVSISGALNTRASTVKARMKIAAASLAEMLGLARAFGGEGLDGSGVVSLDARVEGPLQRIDALAYSGTGTLRNASIRTAALTKPVELRSADLQFEKNSATLNNLVCSLAGSTLRGSVTARSFASPDIGFQLDIDRLDLAEVQQLAAPPKPGGKSAAPAGQLSARGTITAGTILYSGLTLNKVRSECVLSRDVLTLSPLTAEVFGGTQRGALTLDMRSQPPRLTLNTKMDSVDANQLLSATTSLKKTLYGLLAAGGDASMGLVPGGDMARTLNGNLNLRLTNGRLAGVNLLNELANLGKFVGYAQRAEPFTNIVQLVGDVRVRDGVASTDNLQLQTDSGTVASAGTVSLVDQSLNLRLTAVLSRGTSQSVGGSRIGGMLTTALANEKGELVIPALVTGTFSKPRFLPDGARVAEMKLKNLLPTSGNPGALTTGILGAVTGQKGAGRSIIESLTGSPAAPQDPAAAKPETQPAPRRIFDVLDSLRKRKEEAKKP
jgi:uncharacterized protein involved in outer membrane biogenesis